MNARQMQSAASRGPVEARDLPAKDYWGADIKLRESKRFAWHMTGLGWFTVAGLLWAVVEILWHR